MGKCFDQEIGQLPDHSEANCVGNNQVDPGEQINADRNKCSAAWGSTLRRAARTTTAQTQQSNQLKQRNCRLNNISKVSLGNRPAGKASRESHEKTDLRCGFGPGALGRAG